jgi:chemotaxis-related protein WspB
MALLLQFQMGADCYVLDATQVAQVLPLVELKQIPHAPAGVAGVFDFRGTPVPVIDLNELALGRAARRCLTTRLIVVHYPDRSGRARLLGLIAEQVTRTLKRSHADFIAAGVTSDTAPYLGPVATDDAGHLVQWIEVQQLIPEAVSAALFRQAEIAT